MERPSAASSDGARLILYCVNPHAYELVRHWAERAGHHLSLIVTSPGPKRARSTGYRQIIAQAPPEQDLLVTTGMRRTAPLLAALEPDLILSFTLPFRLPLEVTTLPRHGAVNLHPAPLPAYRGPNPARMVFDGAPTLGATLHRTAEEFDTGAILSRQEEPTPAAITRATVLEVWAALLRRALDEGVARALADEPGTPQEEAGASYAASFAPEAWRLNTAPTSHRYCTLWHSAKSAEHGSGARQYSYARTSGRVRRHDGPRSMPPDVALLTSCAGGGRIA
jgi:methionyl-tRNA formyltransferase